MYRVLCTWRTNHLLDRVDTLESCNADLLVSNVHWKAQAAHWSHHNQALHSQLAESGACVRRLEGQLSEQKARNALLARQIVPPSAPPPPVPSVELRLARVQHAIGQQQLISQQLMSAFIRWTSQAKISAVQALANDALSAMELEGARLLSLLDLSRGGAAGVKTRLLKLQQEVQRRQLRALTLTWRGSVDRHQILGAHAQQMKQVAASRMKQLEATAARALELVSNDRNRALQLSMHARAVVVVRAGGGGGRSAQDG